MKPTLFKRLLFYFIGYTALLVGVLYLAQRFLAPTLYFNQIVADDEREITQIIAAFKGGETPLELERISENFEGEISIYSAQGTPVYDETFDGALRSIDVVRIFQEDSVEQLTGAPQEYLEVYRVDGAYIYRMKTPFAPFVSNIVLLNQFFLILVGLSVLLVVPISYVFARSFTKPVVKLNQMAKSFAALDFKLTAPMARRDEIGELSRTLESMALKLSKTLTDLEKELAKEKELDRLQKAFVARISHEIKTPLSIILAATESIHQHVPDAKKDYETMIFEEIERLSDLTDDLIDLSQLESGRFTVHKTPLSIRPLIQSVIKTLTPLSAREMTLTGDDFTVDGDEKRLLQVFRNLIKNTLDHSDLDGAITIHCDAPSQTVTLTNPHTPIEADTLARFGDPFYKPNETHEGHGLGLAIALQLLKLHAASLTFKYDERMTVRVQF